MYPQVIFIHQLTNSFRKYPPTSDFHSPTNYQFMEVSTRDFHSPTNSFRKYPPVRFINIIIIGDGSYCLTATSTQRAFDAVVQGLRCRGASRTTLADVSFLACWTSPGAGVVADAHVLEAAFVVGEEPGEIRLPSHPAPCKHSVKLRL